MTKETYISSLLRKVALTIAAVCVTVSAFAREPFPNGGELEANIAYSILKEAMSATFTASQTGKIQYTCGTGFHAYSDEAHKTMKNYKFISSTNGQSHELDVTKGEVLYFYCDAYDAKYTLLSTFYFKITESAPIEVIRYNDKEGSSLSLTDGYGTLLIDFNQPVHAEKITVKIEGTSYEKEIAVKPLNEVTLAIIYQSALEGWFETGELQGGESLVFTVSGITNAAGEKYNNGEDLVLSYKAPASFTKIREVNVPETFMSYWRPGDENAIATASYTGKISKASYELTFGDAESGDYYVETGSSDESDSPAKVKIDGNTVSIDFSGKQRRPMDMVESGLNYDNLTLRISAWDVNASPVLGESQIQVGGVNRNLIYSVIPTVELNQTFTPASGETLNGEETIEINIHDYDKIFFDGVKFEIQGSSTQSAAMRAVAIAKTIIVPKADITVIEGTNDDCTLVIPVPEEVRETDARVIVTFENLSSLDGMDYSNDIRAVYNGFTITSFELYTSTGQLITDRTLAQLQAGSKVMILPNLTETYPNMYIEYQVLDLYDGETTTLIPSVVLNKTKQGADIVYQQSIIRPVKMIRGHKYHIVFTAWSDKAAKGTNADPLGEEYFVFEGSSEPFSFSDIQFVSADPANGTTIRPDQTEFVLTYDGIVNVNISTSRIVLGTTYVNFSSITPVDPQSGLANVWIFTIPANFIADNEVETLEFIVRATDENEKTIEGNEGVEENSYLLFTYPIAFDQDTVEYTTLPASNTVKSLDKVTITFPVSTSIGTGTATLAINGAPAVELGDPEVESDEANATSFSYTLPENYTAMGTYEIVFPKGYFVGETDNAYPEITLTYFIGETGIEAVFGDAETIDVFSFDGRQLVNNGTVEDIKALAPGFYIINGRKAVIK